MPRADPVVNELIQNALDNGVEEGGLATVRAAGSPFLSSSSGIACALFDTMGRQVTQNAGGLLHVSALRLMYKELLKSYPPDSIVDGDLFMSNDHFKGGIHPTDIGVFRPIFHRGKLVLFSAAMMIVTDLGGVSAGGLPANATEIFHEGVVIPPLRYWEAGKPVAALELMLRANTRAPEKLMGDINALIAGVNVASARVCEVLDRYGSATVTSVIEHLVEYSRHMTRVGIQAIGDGTYRGRYEIESDGLDERKSLTVCCAIEIRGTSCRMDFTGTDRQARGPINCSLSQAVSGAAYALRCYLDPSIPMNEGFYDAIEIILPPGSLLNPYYPAACNLRMASVNGMFGAVNQAFAEAYPERVMAGSSAAITVTVGGVRGTHSHDWAMVDADFGVCGARLGLDGVDGAPPPFYSSPGWMRSIEGYELEYPVEYQDFRLLPDSAGPGEWRGATAVIKHLKFTADGWLTVRGSDGFERGPRGLAGGKNGGRAAWILNEGTAGEERLPAKKTNHYLKAGDCLTLINGGGGGYGDPLRRDPQAVARDVRNGVVTRERARSDYGVEVDASGVIAHRIKS